MRREQRLRRAADFAAVRAEGRVWRHPLLLVRARPNGMTHTRFGISVSRRLGKAVSRNRVKRLLRESIRREEFEGGWDVVIVAREAAKEASFHQISGAVRQVLGRAGLRRGSSPTEADQ